MIVDTHTHPYLDEYLPDKTESMRRAIDAGVKMMVMPNVDRSTIEPMKALHREFPDNTIMAMGLHPTEINSEWQTDLSVIEQELLSGATYHAVGEVGIDLYWDATYRDAQMESFDTQIGWAGKLNIPVIIHCRNGLDEVLDIIKAHKGNIPELIFHSFGGEAGDVDRIRDICDPWFGINGIVTFKNSQLRNVLKHIGTGRLLLETDAPYLSPVPFRGRRNESAYITNTARHMAETLQLPLETLENMTSENAAQVFNFTL